MVTVSDKISPGIDSWVSKPEWWPKKTRINVALEPKGQVKKHWSSAPKRDCSRAWTRRKSTTFFVFQDYYVICKPSNHHTQRLVPSFYWGKSLKRLTKKGWEAFVPFLVTGSISSASADGCRFNVIWLRDWVIIMSCALWEFYLTWGYAHFRPGQGCLS